MIVETGFSEKLSFVEYRDNGFLAMFGSDGKFYTTLSMKKTVSATSPCTQMFDFSDNLPSFVQLRPAQSNSQEDVRKTAARKIRRPNPRSKHDLRAD